MPLSHVGEDQSSDHVSRSKIPRKYAMITTFFWKKNALPANWALQIGGRSVTTYVTKNHELYITRNLPFRWGSKTKIDKETTFSYFHSAHATEPHTFASKSTHPRIELNWLSWWPSWQFLSWAAKRPETIIFRYTASSWHDTNHKQLRGALRKKRITWEKFYQHKE